MRKFTIKQKSQVDDNIGGFTESWDTLKDVYGYLDMLSGTDENTVQNAFTEQSTHVLIIPQYTAGINDGTRVVDDTGRWYAITFVDDPVGVHHHLEVYCTFGGAS